MLLKSTLLTARAIRTLMLAVLMLAARMLALTVSNFTQLPAHLI